MKVLAVGATLSDGQTDRRVDMKKLIVAFRNFAKALKTHSLLQWDCCKINAFSHRTVVNSKPARPCGFTPV
jgi:hypothetical protein